MIKMQIGYFAQQPLYWIYSQLLHTANSQNMRTQRWRNTVSIMYTPRKKIRRLYSTEFALGVTLREKALEFSRCFCLMLDANILFYELFRAEL